MEKIVNRLMIPIASIINTIISHISGTYRDKKKMQFEQDQQIFRNRPELKLIHSNEEVNAYDEMGKSIESDIDILVAKINNVNVTNKSFLVEFDESISNREDWVYRAYKLINVGKSPIYAASFISLFKKSTCIFKTDFIQNNIVSDGYLNYSVLIDKRLDNGESWTIRLVYNRDNITTNLFSAPFVFCLHGEKGTYWEQPFFDASYKIYEARRISYKEYSDLISSEKAIECFEKPWLW